MRPVDYVPVSQEGSGIEEKDFFLPNQRTPLSPQWKRDLLILGTALVGSICANAFFIYRQFVKPWELLDELPTKFGKIRYHVVCLAKKTDLYVQLASVAIFQQRFSLVVTSTASIGQLKMLHGAMPM